MTTNLIQLYNSTNKPVVQKQNAQALGSLGQNTKSKPKTASAKPLKPTGKLVNGSIFDAPAILVSDTYYDLKSAKNGVQGKSNDHQLGKVNDIGMKVGGLGIATYLFSQRAFPKGKAMEFVGWASFFGSMALWPKLAIEFPAYIIHGFNVQKRYVDSFGRKKPVFQDPQYIPWDLYSDKEINKIGNRLGVPKDIENRRSAIQEKMRKIAIQNNTLWMLTAGFATPIMSALICNQAEKLVEKVEKMKVDQKSKTAFNTMANSANKYVANPNLEDADAPIKNKNEFEVLIKKLKGKPIEEGTFDRLSNVMTATNVIPPIVERSLNNLFSSEEFTANNDIPSITNETLEQISNKMPELYAQFLPKIRNKKYHQGLKEAMLSVDELKELFNEDMGKPASSDLLGKMITKMSQKAKTVFKPEDEEEEDQLFKHISDMYKDNGLDNFFYEEIKKNVSTDDVDEMAKEAPKINLNNVNTLDDKKIEKLRQINQKMANYNAEINPEDLYQQINTGATEDSVLAKACNEFKSKLFGILGFSKNDVKNARFDHFTASDVLKESFEKITSDDKKYEDTISKLTKEVKVLFDKIGLQKEIESFDQSIDATLNHFANAFREIGLPEIAEDIYREEDFSKGSVRYFMKDQFRERINGVSGSFLNLIHSLDSYRRISNIEKLSGNISPEEKDEILKKLGPIANEEMPTVTKQELIELAKRSINFHTADYETKFFTRRQKTTIDKNVTSEDLIVKGGKLIDSKTNLEFIPAENAVEMNYDSSFFKDEMNFLFNSGMDNATEKALNDNGLLKEFEGFRTRIYDDFGSTAPETKENMLMTDFNFLNSISNDHFKEIQGCKDFNDLSNVFKYAKYEPYSNATSLQELMQTAGIGGIKTVEDLKELSKSVNSKHIPIDRFNELAQKLFSKYGSTSEKRFNFIGQTADELINQVANSKFNTNKWLKTFTKAGAILLGVTVTAQFLFGMNSKTAKAKAKVKKG